MDHEATVLDVTSGNSLIACIFPVLNDNHLSILGPQSHTCLRCKARVFSGQKTCSEMCVKWQYFLFR